MKYTISEALEEMARIANETADLRDSLPEGVRLCNIEVREVHVDRGLRTLAKEAGAEVTMEYRNGSEFCFKASFTAVGIKFFQIGRTEEAALA